jgi:hypothetical protein
MVFAKVENKPFCILAIGILYLEILVGGGFIFPK